ncbi:probable disease resistance protein At1g12290 [Tripterygium wilfordii]|uniref:probable disease resistance protein At1g12290 n=1 Tax=Tripterygium wilfordii TaxID=458696 RepID=UPI0018F7F4B0|nr:probable disease resistance protein At1g12290 [Tripterygium wilfordii]
MVVVSQTINVESIQDQIGEFLGLKLGEKGEMLRANRLCDRLKSENKILVILDDVWAKIDLATICIPSGEDHKGCKVVIITWRRQVCIAMGSSVLATRIVTLDVSTKQESWYLFKLETSQRVRRFAYCSCDSGKCCERQRFIRMERGYSRAREIEAHEY